ncbi:MULTISPECIES: hypothetical protein [unclassified Pseudomonas]|uniref:hypothetical protein n=1 Tax=unclassified Pseudomonas TaxID=196821 RepID=UPI00313309D2
MTGTLIFQSSSYSREFSDSSSKRTRRRLFGDVGIDVLRRLLTAEVENSPKVEACV